MDLDDRAGLGAELHGIGRECDARLVPRREADRLLPVRREGQRWPGPAEAVRGLGGRRRWPEPAPGQPADARGPGFPAWSPDGTRILFESADGSPGRAAGHLHGPSGWVRRPPADDGRGLDRCHMDRGWTDPLRAECSGQRWVAGLVDDGRRRRRAPPSSCRAPRSGSRRRASRRPVRPGSRPVGRPSCLLRGPPGTAIAVGPPAPTPSPTATPSLAPGFAWTGALTSQDGGPAGQTATLLADGRVLMIRWLRHGRRAVRPDDRRVHADRLHDGRRAPPRPRRGCRMAASCSRAGPAAAMQTPVSVPRPSCTTRRPARSARPVRCTRRARATPPRFWPTVAC